MKRTPLLFAGIVAATILVIMGMGILLTGSFYFIPSITIDPFSDGEIDENGILVLTGTTNLGLNTFLLVNITDGLPGGENVTSLVSVLPETGGRNSWKAAVNVSPLPPGEYTLRVSSVDFTVADRTAIPGDVSVTEKFTHQKVFKINDRSHPDPFICGNPVGERAAGERIPVDGTTNLGTGTTIQWKVDRVRCLENEEGAPIPETTLPAGSTAVSPGIAGINRWSFSFESSGMEPGCYVVNITGNRTLDTVELVLSGSAPVATPTPSGFVTVDAIPHVRESSRVTITGTTSLPAGEELVIEITPRVSSGYDFVISPDGRSRSGVFAGIAGTAVVVQGTGGINLWSMDFDTYHLFPGEYGVKVSGPGINTEQDIDVSATARFILRGEGQ